MCPSSSEVEVVDLAAASGERAFSFGPFHLLPDRRLLLEGDKLVRLGSRALDILIALVEHPGELVGKDELIARVWPNTHVGIPLATAPPGSSKRPRTRSCRRNRPGVHCP